MPTPLLKKVASKCKLKLSDVEAIWSKAKGIAKGEGNADNYAYITQIFKSLLGKSNCKKMGYCKATAVVMKAVTLSSIDLLTADSLGYGRDTIKDDDTKADNKKSSKDVAAGNKTTAKKSLKDIDDEFFKKTLRQGG